MTRAPHPAMGYKLFGEVLTALLEQPQLRARLTISN
jgi:hypothetical protein